MSDEIFNARIPWFEPYTIGILWGDEDPHKAKGSLFSQSGDTEEMMRDIKFVEHIQSLEQKLAEAEKKIQEKININQSEALLNTSLSRENKKLEQKLSEALEVIRFYAGDDKGFQKRGETRAREFFKKHAQ